MGTRRKVVLWKKTRWGFTVIPPGWKPKDGEITFSTQQQMIDFARSMRAVLKDVTDRRRYDDHHTQRL